MNQTIAFGIYKDGQLQGFRADSFGSIRSYPKFYGYSEKQVETVVKSTEYTARTAQEEKEHFMVGVLANCNPGAAALLGGGLNADQAKQKELGNFELRVIPFPQIEDHLESSKLPSREVFKEWIEAGLAEPLEVYAITPLPALA